MWSVKTLPKPSWDCGGWGFRTGESCRSIVRFMAAPVRFRPVRFVRSSLRLLRIAGVARPAMPVAGNVEDHSWTAAATDYDGSSGLGPAGGRRGASLYSARLGMLRARAEL